MSDQAAAKPRRGGWPKGRPRTVKAPYADVQEVAPAGIGHNSGLMPKAAPSMLSKMRARPNWEGEDFVGPDYDMPDRLQIPPDLVKALWRDGVALEWGTQSVLGQEMVREMADAARKGWTVVHNDDFDGVLDGVFMPKGSQVPVTVGASILYARPVGVHVKAKEGERRAARLPLQIAEEQIGHGIPGVTGSDHISAISQNKIKKTMEVVEIPD